MGSQLIKHNNYVAGWLDSSVHDFLAEIPAAFPSIQFALITCLDSHRAPADLLATSPELLAIGAGARALGHGLLLPTSMLLAAEASNRIMFGFDEVWFFPHDDIRAKTVEAGLVGPGRIRQPEMDLLGRWMEANSCSMGLGDGEGLNLILQARGLMKYFVGNSIHQPSPSGVS